MKTHDKEILRLALPALGALAAEPLYVLGDTAVVGHLGTDPLGGLALASTVLLLIHSIFIFLAYGTTAGVARALGAGNESEAANQAVQSMWLAAAIGSILAVCGGFLAPTLVAVLGGEGEIAMNALIYLRISLLGIPALLVVLAGTGYLRGLQDTKTTLLIAVISALTNLALELLLIQGLGFGIAASAWSTVVVQYGSLGVYLWRMGPPIKKHDVRLMPDVAAIRGVARIGGPLLVRTIALRASLTLATAVAARTNSSNLAAHHVTFEIWSLLALGLDAVAIAAQALIGRFLGARDAEGARAIGHRMLRWGLLSGCALGLGILALHRLIPHIFTSDPTVVRSATTLLLVVAALQPVNGLVFVLDGLLIGAGDTRYLAKAMVVSAAAFTSAALVVVLTGPDVVHLWFAIGVLMVVRLTTLWFRWQGDDWVVMGSAKSG